MTNRLVDCYDYAMSTEAPHPSARDAILDSGQRIMSRRGFSAVGLSEILGDAGVPKGSFYYHFGSKDAFGAAMLERYFHDYVAHMDVIANSGAPTGAAKVFQYLADWRDGEAADECAGKCLAVKLGAEVADLSEVLRGALEEGIGSITGRLEGMLTEGVRDGSIRLAMTENEAAKVIYELWFGATVATKITRNPEALDLALATTRRLTS